MMRALIVIAVVMLLAGCVSFRYYDHVSVAVDVSADGADIESSIDAYVLPGGGI